MPHPEQIGNLKDYGFDIRAQVVDAVRAGLLDKVLSDDVALVAAIKEEAFGSDAGKAE